jgi:hypothetical protein
LAAKESQNNSLAFGCEAKRNEAENPTVPFCFEARKKFEKKKLRICTNPNSV